MATKKVIAASRRRVPRSARRIPLILVVRILATMPVKTPTQAVARGKIPTERRTAMSLVIMTNAFT